MNYIVLDMEWNQPYGKANAVTEPVYLHGEIIRIGAVMLNGSLNEVSRFHSCVMPEFYKKMNSSVGKVTGLGSRSIAYGRKFPDAFADFMSWCGNDAVILTWGSEDEKIMEANLAVHNISCAHLPKFYDLQKIFAHKITCDGRQYSLQAALEYYSLPADLKAHDALNDAIYTSRIGRKMDFPLFLDGYDEMIKAVEEKKSERHIRTYQNIPGIKEAMASKRITACRCPKCRRIMKREKFVFHRENIAVSRAKCDRHGSYFVRIKFTQCPDGSYSVTRKIKFLTAEYSEIYDKACHNSIIHAQNPAEKN